MRQTTSDPTRAHFRITVRNTGDVTLHGVTVEDPLSPACNRRLGRLAAGHSATYRCGAPSVSRSYANIATATGTSPKGTKVTASDSALVTVKKAAKGPSFLG